MHTTKSEHQCDPRTLGGNGVSVQFIGCDTCVALVGALIVGEGTLGVWGQGVYQTLGTNLVSLTKCSIIRPY